MRRALSFFPLVFLPALHIMVRHTPARMRLGVYGSFIGAYSLLSVGMYFSDGGGEALVDEPWTVQPQAPPSAAASLSGHQKLT